MKIKNGVCHFNRFDILLVSFKSRKRMNKTLKTTLIFILILFIIFEIFFSIPFVKIGKDFYFFNSEEINLYNKQNYDEKDLKNISKLKKLKSLDLRTNLTDLSFFKDLSELQKLFMFIDNPKEADYSYLSNCKKIEDIGIFAHDIDASYFQNCNNLKMFTLYSGHINNIERIWNCSNLTSVCISATRPGKYNVNGVSKCKNLKKLCINFPSKVNLDELNECPKINFLGIYSDIENYDFLIELKSLKELVVKSNELPDNVRKVLENRKVDITEY